MLGKTQMYMAGSMLVLPMLGWCLIMGCFSWRKSWRVLLFVLMLVPSISIALGFSSDLPDAEREFQKAMGQKLPASAEIIHFHYLFGPQDSTIGYHLKLPGNEVQSLLRELNLQAKDGQLLELPTDVRAAAD